MVKYLLIRFSSIGDIVLTTPLIRCLKEQVGEAEVHFLTKERFVSLLCDNPYVDKVHTLDDNSQITIGALKEEEFDYILDLHNNIRSLNIKRSLKRMYFTVNKLNVRKWLLVNFKINRLPDVHIADRYLHTARLFSVQNDGKGLDYFIPREDEISIDSLPSFLHKGYIALVIGAHHATKCLPHEKLVELVHKIKHPLIVIGGPEDREKAEKLHEACRDNPMLNACGKYSINQSASLIKQANCVISHDTGMMHIAAAFKKKILAVWGNTVRDFGMYAYLPDPGSKDFEVENLSCRPCSKLGYPACPKKHFKCMMEQDTSVIAETANRLY